MTRRNILFMTSLALLAAVQGRRVKANRRQPASRSVDPELVQLYESVQTRRPAALTSMARVVSSTEPGIPLTVHGQLFNADGFTAAGATVIFAYQTDAAGLYNHPGERGWRLCAWARTNSLGKFTLESVHPGPYPGRDVPAHIHLHAELADGSRHVLKELRFEGDPLLKATERAAANALGRFGHIRPVTVRDGRETCEILFRLPGDYVF